MEEKTHFKMYKAKTKWMVAGVTMFSTMLGVGHYQVFMLIMLIQVVLN